MQVTTAPTTPTSPRRSGSALRRLVLMALAALIVGSGLGFAPQGADAITPGMPKMLAPVGYDGSALVGWSLPHSGGKLPTQFKVERYKVGVVQPEKVYVLGGSQMWLLDKGLTNGENYQYRVQAWNQDGPSTWSTKETASPAHFKSFVEPFAEEATFVKRQYQDFLGRQPNANELAAGIDMVDSGPTAPFIDSLANQPARASLRKPVIRLYFAFFERMPDAGGAEYWIAKRKNGTTLNQIASSFAGSSEFKNTYGALSNSAFVKQIYVNVFDRQPDPNGHAYWTNKLNNGSASRGQVMVGFSESNEYAGSNGTPGLSTGRVEAADLWITIIDGPLSTDSLLTYYAPHIQFGGTQGSMAMLLMPKNGYKK